MAGRELLNSWLRILTERGGSDLHIKTGAPPALRVDGGIVRLDCPALSAESTKSVLYDILTPERIRDFEAGHELDLAYSVPGLARFRVNLFRQKGNIGAVLRQIPIHIKSLEDLGLPDVVRRLSRATSGLILVTGPTGSGKSTTLAAMIQEINNTSRGHIVTIEDPIEFLHEDRMCSVTQRELGADTRSFASALKSVVRQNPDVILVGELRDLETIALAITAAETGHLVLGTLHTSSASQTVDRVIDVFPPTQQPQIRMQLAATLQAVISQTLMRKADGSGRLPAFEILINSPAVASLIREGKSYQLDSLIEGGREHGMLTLDQYLKNLYVEGLITFDEACSKCSNPKDFEELLQRNLSAG